MLEWAWPWLFALLPLPWIVARTLPRARLPSGAALHLPLALAGLDAAEGAAPVPRWRGVLALVAWLLLLTSAARPQWIGDAQALRLSIIAVILSLIALVASEWLTGRSERMQGNDRS